MEHIVNSGHPRTLDGNPRYGSIAIAIVFVLPTCKLLWPRRRLFTSHAQVLWFSSFSELIQRIVLRRSIVALGL